MALNFKEEQEIFSLKVDDTSKSHLLETMRWAKFIGILFSIFVILACALMAFIMLVYMPGMQTPMPAAGPTVVIISLVMVGVNFYPIFALLKFSVLTKKAINNTNQQQFNTALKYMKNLFRYIGILTIILITFYGVVFLGSLLAGRS